jgi:uncharacterized membrane protein YdfJ with MMPL/SSD domain
MMRPRDRDLALARLRRWRAGIAVAGTALVAIVGAVAAATIPGRAADRSTGAASTAAPAAQDQQSQQLDPGQGFGGGLQPPRGGLGAGFGGGHAASGGS